MIWRKGTVDDPYVERVEILPVVNQRIQLLEVPDQLSRVKIPKMTEINHSTYIEKKLKENEFYVDYSNGMVFFHVSKESETLTVEYRGRGFILYPATRIYHHDHETDIVTKLSDIAQLAIDKMNELEESHLDLSALKTQLEDTLKGNHTTSDQLKKVIEQALIAIDLVDDAYKTTKIIHRPFVQTYSDIKDKYPFPLVGWTVQVFDTGIRYRWNGAEWTPIDILGGNVPLANENVDGLLSKEKYSKLNAITDNVDTRVIVFIVPQEVLSGLQDPHITFPFNGNIEKISASISHAGSSNTSIRLEKSTDYIEWKSVTDAPIQINAKEHFDNKNHTILNKKVNRGDIFRLYIPYSGDVKNLTLNVEIKIEN